MLSADCADGFIPCGMDNLSYVNRLLRWTISGIHLSSLLIMMHYHIIMVTQRAFRSAHAANTRMLAITALEVVYACSRDCFREVRS